jgi:hypothetical protein
MRVPLRPYRRRRFLTGRVRVEQSVQASDGAASPRPGSGSTMASKVAPSQSAQIRTPTQSGCLCRTIDPRQQPVVDGDEDLPHGRRISGYPSRARPAPEGVSSWTTEVPRGHARGGWWRWRESNPRPRTIVRGFYERSQRWFSSPGSRRQRTLRPARVRFPAAAPGRSRLREPASDARPPAAGDPGRAAT